MPAVVPIVGGLVAKTIADGQGSGASQQQQDQGLQGNGSPNAPYDARKAAYGGITGGDTNESTPAEAPGPHERTVSARPGEPGATEAVPGTGVWVKQETYNVPNTGQVAMPDGSWINPKMTHQDSGAEIASKQYVAAGDQYAKQFQGLGADFKQQFGGLQNTSQGMSNQFMARSNAQNPAWAQKGVQFDAGQADQSRNLQMGAYGSQMDAVEMQHQAALGNRPSVAQAQYQQGLANSQAAMHSMAASAQGPLGQAAAYRHAMGQGGTMLRQGNMDMAVMRAQEDQANRAAYMQGAQGLSNTTAAIRSPDEQRAMGLAQEEGANRRGLLTAQNQNQQYYAGAANSAQTNALTAAQYGADARAQAAKAAQGATFAGLNGQQSIQQTQLDANLRQEGIGLGEQGRQQGINERKATQEHEDMWKGIGLGAQVLGGVASQAGGK